MTIQIDAAARTDLPAILAIENVAFSDPWSERAFRDAIENPVIYFACARNEQGRVAGYVVAWFVGGEGEIANLAVSPDADAIETVGAGRERRSDPCQMRAESGQAFERVERFQSRVRQLLGRIRVLLGRSLVGSDDAQGIEVHRPYNIIAIKFDY